MSGSPRLLRSALEDRSAAVGVIGLGYVGLPAACMFASAGFRVNGVDLDGPRTEVINSGRSPIKGDEPGLAELLSQVVASKHLRTSTDYADLAKADIVLICVDTPVDSDHRPRFKALRSACSQLGAVLKQGAVVIVESTIAPGTIDTVVKPALEEASGRKAGAGFHLGHCPERVMPGKLLRNMRTMSRVCGGSSPEVSELMIALYSTFVEGDLDAADCLTAELVKTAENAYRDVGIAFANQLALISERVGGDAWRVRTLVNKVPGRNVLLPGGGVGGHCIPKDSWLLATPLGSGAEDSLLGVARHINDGMPAHVARLVQELVGAAHHARVTVLGYAYLENSDDTRNSPSAALIDVLTKAGFETAVHDPFVHEHEGDVMDALRGADCAVLMVAHNAYRNLDLKAAGAIMKAPRMVDARGFFESGALRDAGFSYRVIGVGTMSTSPPK
ncbi:MAG TPA: nucleotide sugar dehydrogenase [Candidatus Micrarchaeaceae archaeon]|nr:nucleotide sugar dehydrogenase [Candidatus Micrarchaeaceae archaeon]